MLIFRKRKVHIRYFARKSDMTAYAVASGHDYVRCTLHCTLERKAVSPHANSIMLIDENRITEKLICCKSCYRIQNGLPLHEKEA